MKKLYEMGQIILRAREAEEAKNKILREIAAHSVTAMVAGSAQILFDTPVPSVIPSDSFANDYELSE